jgi:hypothetical protein
LKGGALEVRVEKANLPISKAHSFSSIFQKGIGTMKGSLPKISSDQPLQAEKAIAEDKLQRTGFARASVAALHRVSATAGFVLSIEGPWGSGKTSTFSIMEKIIRSEGDGDAVIVHFNPWLVGDRDSLLRQFLTAIAAEIEITDNAGNAKRVSKELLNYANVFDFVKWLPGAEPWASLVKGVIESAGKATGAVADQKARDIEGQKERVEKELRKFKKKIFVFIDDIDRLFPVEVFEMVRIIKAIGHLPNVGYIVAWDAEYIRRALRAASVPRASAYIDKIVQVRLPLPAITANARLRLLNDGIASLPDEATSPLFPKQNERLQSLYFHGMRDLLEQPRDITRVINTVSVIEPGIRGEVVFADILGMACLMVRAPRVFEELRRDPGLFTKEVRTYGTDESELRQEYCRKMDALYAKSPHPGAVRELVHHLFPTVAKSSGLGLYGRSVDVEGHISAPSRLNIALGMAIGEADVSIVDAKRFATSPSERAAIQARLTKDNCPGFLEMVADVCKTLTEQQVGDLPELCLALSRLIDCDPFAPTGPRRGVMSLSTHVIALAAITQTVQSIAPERVGEIGRQIACDQNSLTVAADIVIDSSQDSHADGRVVFESSVHGTVMKKFVANVLRSLEQGTFWSHAEPQVILWAVLRATKASAKKVYVAIKRDDPTLDQFALTFLKHSFSSSGGQSYAFPSDPDAQKLVGLATLVRHAKSRLGDSTVQYPVRAAWQAVVEGKALYGSDGSKAR